MELVRRWLARLDPVGGAAIAEALETLPGRDPYARGPGECPAIQAAEWSVREGSAALRFAWNVDEGRVPVATVFAVLERWGALPEEVRALEFALRGVHLQVGRDGDRVKLYVYGAGALDGPLARGRPLAADFMALDLRPAAVAGVGADPRVRPSAIKHYFQLPRPQALAHLRDLGAGLLADWGESLADDLGSPPGEFVVSERRDRGDLRDVTLHVKVDRAPERLAELAGAELSSRLAEHFRAAARLRLWLRPTYVSRLWTPGGGLVGTVYYRLEGRRERLLPGADQHPVCSERNH